MPVENESLPPLSKGTTISVILSSDPIMKDSLIVLSCIFDSNNFQNTELEWNIGQSVPTKYTINNHHINHRFAQTGLYTLSLVLRDINTLDTIATLDTVFAVINNQNDTNIFSTYRYMSYYFKAKATGTTSYNSYQYDLGKFKTDSAKTSNYTTEYSGSGGYLKWEGNLFYISEQTTTESYEFGWSLTTIQKSIYGRMSFTFESIDSLKIYYSSSTSSSSQGSTFSSSSLNDNFLALKALPVTTHTKDSTVCIQSGKSVSSFVTKYVYGFYNSEDQGAIHLSHSIDSIHWHNNGTKPYLKIKFSK